MHILIFIVLFSILGTGGLWAAVEPQAQEIEAEAREAIAPIEEEEIEEILEVLERRYTLLRRGHWELEYSLTYSYHSDVRIIPFDPAFAIYEHEKHHAFTNSISVSYGVRDNLQLSASIPFVHKFEDVGGLEETALGDISISLQRQPVGAVPGWPTITLYTTFNTRTGRSPYEIDLGRELATGSGHYSLGAGVNFSKVIDPLVVFGGIGYTYSLEERDLHQKLPGGGVLQGVEQGATISLNMGIAFALTHEVSLNAIWRQSYTFRPYLWIDGERLPGSPANSAMLQMGAGLRLSPRTSLHVNVAHGLTPDSPDFSVSFRLPFGFKAN